VIESGKAALLRNSIFSGLYKFVSIHHSWRGKKQGGRATRERGSSMALSKTATVYCILTTEDKTSLTQLAEALAIMRDLPESKGITGYDQ